MEVSLRNELASLRALSPKATVPVLHLSDGRVIEESWDIMRWALAEPDPLGWWERAQSADNLELVQRNDGDFKRHLDRWKYPQRCEIDSQSSDFHRDAAKVVMLDLLEGRLRHGAYLGGTTACATDLAVMPFVRQYAAVDPEWFASQELPSVQAWLHGWLASPLFMACMQKVAATPA